MAAGRQRTRYCPQPQPSELYIGADPRPTRPRRCGHDGMDGCVGYDGVRYTVSPRLPRRAGNMPRGLRSSSTHEPDSASIVTSSLSASEKPCVCVHVRVCDVCASVCACVYAQPTEPRTRAGIVTRGGRSAAPRHGYAVVPEYRQAVCRKRGGRVLAVSVIAEAFDDRSIAVQCAHVCDRCMDVVGKRRLTHDMVHEVLRAA